ncbi:MAG: hypothetical protein ACFE9L_20070 [Candidatus Hodarchaeota archaeon]
MISKLLDHPITIPILKNLSEKPQTISQILNSMKDDADFSTILAILAELYYFGLVEQSKPVEKDKLSQRSKKIENDSEKIQDVVLRTYKTTLGIPLIDYIFLWENVQQDPNEKDLEEFNNRTFFVPNQLANIFIKCTPDEIRVKLLNPSF